MIQSSLLARTSGIVVSIAAFALMCLGLIMVTSTSVWIEDPGQEYEHLTKQSIFAVIGITAAFSLACFDYRHFRKYWVWIFAITCLFLALCYVPGIKVTANGESRWVRFGSIQFQPSEAAKIGLMISLAGWFAGHRSAIRSLKNGFFVPMSLAGAVMMLIFFEKDMGTTFALSMAVFALLFIVGTRLLYLIPTALGACAGMYYMTTMSGNRMARIYAWQDLYASRMDQGLQQWRALLAFANGGFDGTGIGNGSEKHGYLPFAHTDFIFPMIAEELGIWGTLGVILSFALIMVFGTLLSLHAHDIFGKVLGIGLTGVVVAPAIINIAVTTAAIPNTGLPLPFVSYGGTSLIFTLCSIGLLISIHRHGKFTAQGKELLQDRQQQKPIRL